MKIEEIQKIVSASLYRIIVDPIEVDEQSKGGLMYASETKENQKYLRYYGQVISMGPLVFSQDKFLDADGVRHRGCEVGDWIAYGQHTGIDICILEGEDVLRLRTINDDQVLAVIHDISQVKIPLV